MARSFEYEFSVPLGKFNGVGKYNSWTEKVCNAQELERLLEHYTKIYGLFCYRPLNTITGVFR